MIFARYFRVALVSSAWITWLGLNPTECMNTQSLRGVAVAAGQQCVLTQNTYSAYAVTNTLIQFTTSVDRNYLQL